MCDLLQRTGEHDWRGHSRRIAITRCNKSGTNQEAERWAVDAHRLLHINHKQSEHTQWNQSWLSNSWNKSIHPNPPKDASIVKNMGTTRNSVKISKDVRSVHKLDMQIMNVTMKWNVQIVKVIILPTCEIVPGENRTENLERKIWKQHLLPWSQKTNWRTSKWSN